MVFHCRCFSLPFEEDEDKEEDKEEDKDRDEEIEYESRTETKSTATTFYTAPSNFNRSEPQFHAKRSGFSNLSDKPNNLRVFTVAELKAATNNFDRAWKIGEDGSGSVYRGVIKSFEDPFDEIQVAVKYTKGLIQGHREWLIEVNFLGMIEHPNLVKLVGYCAVENERGMQLFLVYEYMPNKSLRDHLSTSSEEPLSWTMRLKVAQDVARAFAYLHEELDFEFIFRDFKSSNILLDDHGNAKLLDFGVARLGPRTRISTMSQGPALHAAPEHIKSGYLSSKSDVWSYGVFLYELITGRCPLDKNLPQDEHNLLEWVGPDTSYKNLERIIDPRLEGMSSLKSTQALMNIALLCLQRNPRFRPLMSEVLKLVDGLIGALSQEATPVKEVVTSVIMGEKTKEDIIHEGERWSINIQLTESPSLPKTPPKSWFRKNCCCVS